MLRRAKGEATIMSDLPFGLRHRAFPATPDYSCYYPATSHEQALGRLLHGLADGEGMMLLTAGPGLGKTLLCHALLTRLTAQTQSAFLTNSWFGDRLSLLQAILYDLSLPYEGKGEQESRLLLMDHLLKGYVDGARTLILVDEAQHLGLEALEELRMLGNLEAGGGKAVQVVLIGQPETVRTLGHPRLGSLRQRLAVRASLEPLPVEEAADYVLHHLRAAGGKADEIIDGEALELLARGTHGVPRLLNQAAHQALLLAAAGEASCVDSEAALEALTMLGLPGDSADEEESPLLIEGAGAARRQVLPLSEQDDEADEEPATPGRTA